MAWLAGDIGREDVEDATGAWNLNARARDVAGSPLALSAEGSLQDVHDRRHLKHGAHISLAQQQGHWIASLTLCGATTRPTGHVQAPTSRGSRLAPGDAAGVDHDFLDGDVAIYGTPRAS